MDEGIRVLICDDHALFRRGLMMVLEEDPEIEVIAEAANGTEAIELARELTPDVVLMDVRMPGCTGIQATREILESVPSAHVIILTVSDDEDDLLEAMKVGAAGYLLKEISIVEVTAAVHSVVAGQRLVTPSLATKLITEFANMERVAAARPDRRPQADRPRARGVALRRRRTQEPGHLGRPGHIREHGQESRAQHPGEAAAALPGAGRALRDRPEPDPGLLAADYRRQCVKRPDP